MELETDFILSFCIFKSLHIGKSNVSISKRYYENLTRSGILKYIVNKSIAERKNSRFYIAPVFTPIVTLNL